jgi:acetolactate synthase-1/2/3 large subunit
LTVGADAARAVQASMEGAGQVATLILPADTAWSQADAVAAPLPTPAPALVSGETIDRIAALARTGVRTAFLLRGKALQEQGLRAAGQIAAKTGARLLCDTFAPRLQRGAGRVPVERLPYFAEQVVEFLAGTELLVLVGAQPPVSFFAYPDKPSWLTPQGCRIAVLAHPQEDGTAALESLVEALGAQHAISRASDRQDIEFYPNGPLDGESIMRSVARHLPENAIITEEASLAMAHYGLTESAAPHDFLTLTGGAIGSMMPVSIGAGVACPERKVVNLVGDGSAMYTLQSLWTMARENIDVVTVIYSNGGYRILANELKRVGARTDGAHAASMFDLGNPSLDWVALARGMGVEAIRAESRETFDSSLAHAMKRRGPMLIEAVI